MNLGWDKERIEEFINNDKPVVIIDEEYFKDNYIRRSKIEEAIRFNEECLRKGKGPDKFTLQYCIIELRRLLEKDSIIIEDKER